MANPRCEALKPDGNRCNIPALRGENRCLFHSKSDQAKAFRKKAGQKSIVSRRELLWTLTRDLRALKNDDSEKAIRLRLQLVPLLSQLVNELEDLAKIRRYAKDKGIL